MALSLDLGDLVVHIKLNTGQFEKHAKNAERIMMSVSNNIARAGIKMSLAVTAPLTLLARQAVKEFAKFEDAVVEIQKVTDKATATKLADSMERLSMIIPVTATELALLAADAARFGIRGTENIERFTATVAKMAIATDLSTEQAGEAFAKLATIAGIPISEMENLGSAINTLSNNYATSAKEIVDGMLRAAGSMKQFGLGAKQMVGLVAIMNEAGFSARRSGTQIRSLLTSLSVPGTVNRLSKELGMTAKQFRNLVKEDPSKVIMDLSKIMASGSDQAFRLGATMSENTFIALQKIGAVAPKVTSAIKDANKAWKEGTSLQVEFEAASKTFNGQMTLMWNSVRRVGRTIGSVLAPMILRLNKIVVRASKWWSGLSKGLQTLIVQIAIFAAAIGPVLIIFAKLIAVGAFFVGLAGSIASAIPFLIAATGWLATMAVNIALLNAPIIALVATMAFLGNAILKNSAIGAMAIEHLGFVFSWWSDMVEGLVGRFKKSWAAIATAILSGDLVGAVRVLWAQINLEWAKGVDAIAARFGHIADASIFGWDIIVQGAITAADIINKTFWAMADGIVKAIGFAVSKTITGLSFIARSVAELGVLIPGIGREGVNKAIMGITQLEQRAAGLAKGLQVSVSSDISARREGARKQFELARESRAGTEAGRGGTAAQAARQLEAAAMAWESAITTVEKQEAARQKVEAPIRKVAKEIEQGEAPGLFDGKTDGAGFFQAGAFLANQVQGIGGAQAGSEPDKKEIEKAQLKEQKKTNSTLLTNQRLWEEITGGVPLVVGS